MIKHSKIILLFLLLILPALVLADQGSADSYGYMWTDADGTVTIDYNWIDLQGETSIFGSSFNDSLSGAISLPFNFPFYGVNRSQIYISSNGWISFVNPGDTTFAINDTIPDGGGPNHALAPYWDDLQSTVGNSGGVYYKEFGTSPDRQFVVEWKVINGSDEINFQIILYEHSNLIKFQYKTVAVAYSGGASATIGIKADTLQGNQYSVNQSSSVASGDAILFHNSSISGVDGSILPTTATIGGFETFSYTINQIDTAGADGLGKLDRIAIKNPFSTIPSVIRVKINGIDALLQYSTSKPVDPGRATWYYDGTGDSLIVQTSLFDIKDAVNIEFNQSIPVISAGSYPFNSIADAEFDKSGVMTPVVQPTVTISSGGLDYLVIRDGPNEGGSVVTSASITTDDSLTLYAAGYDAADNYLGDQNANWTITGTLGGSGGSGTSFKFQANIAPAFGTIEAESGGIGKATGGITVGVGALDELRIRTDSNNGGVVVTTMTMTTDDTQEFWSAGYDADDNYRGDEATTVWTSTLGIGGSGESILFAPAAPVIGTLTATIGGTSYTTGTITVNSGDIDYLIIRDAANNEGSPVGNRTLTTDDTLTIYAASYDSDDNYLGDRDATWTVSGNLGSSGSSGTSYTFNPAVAPASGTISAEVGEVSDDTGVLTVNVGILDDIVIRTGENEGGSVVTTLNMTTDQSFTFWAAGYDADGNYRGDESATVWTSTIGISGSGPSILFDPDAPVSGTLTATVGAVFHTTGTIAVTSGTISYLKIRTGAGGAGSEVNDTTITADNVLNLHAAAYDGSGNFIADQNVEWSVTGTLDGPTQISIPYAFSPVLAPTSGSIVARLGSSHSTTTGTITVTTGALQTVRVRTEANGAGDVVTTLSMSTDETQTFWAAGYDADENFRQDEPTAVWTSTLGISGSGSSILFAPAAPILGTLTANVSGNIYTTGTITVTGGDLHHIIIRDSLNVEINDRTITADQQLKLFAAGYDEENNFIGNQVVNWTVTGSLDGGDQAGTSIYTFNPQLAPAFGSITASVGGNINDATGTITVNVGTLSRISVNTTPDAGGVPFTGYTLTTDQSITFYAVGYDADNNFINPVNAVWTKTGTLDTVIYTGSGYTFSPSTAPTIGTIVATYLTHTDDSGIINVIEGSIDHIIIRNAPGGGGIEFNTANITADDSLVLYAAGYDGENNFLQDISATWFSTGGNLDQISAVGSSLTFQPVKAPSSGQIGAQAPNVIPDFTGTINVALGVLSEIRINDAVGALGQEIGNETIGAGQDLNLFASGYDSDGNYREAITATWSRTGTIDTVYGSGTSYTFTPITAPSSGTIVATGGGFSDTTGAISVISGSLSSFKLRSQPNGLGIVIADTVMTADGSLLLYAAGYDANNNYLDDYSVDWYSTGNLDDVSATGESYTFNPVIAPTSGRIGATNGTNNAFTGTISVAVGDTNRIVINSSDGPGGQEFTTGSYQAGSQIPLYAAAYDLDGNYISPVNATWSSTGSLDSVSATGASYTFIPVTAPSSGTIKADFFEYSDVTGLIEIGEGTLSYIQIRTAPLGEGVVVVDTTITADNTMPLFAAGYDDSGNHLRDLTVSWSSSGTIDNVFATGSTYVFTPVTAPTSGSIRITSGDKSYQTGTITVNVGALNKVAITNASGPAGVAVDNIAMTADESRTFYAAAYDADNNFINNVPAVWSRTGTLDLVSGTATSFLFNPTTAPTSGFIRIDYLGFFGLTGTIDVAPGALWSIRVNSSAGAGGLAVGALTLSVGQQLTVFAAGYDQYSNYRGLEEAVWQTTPSLDSQNDVGESFTFTPLTANTSGTIVGTVNGYNDPTGTITVTEGGLTYIKIRTGANGTGVEFTGTDMTADETLTLHAAGYDAGNNYLNDVVVNWTSIGSLNPVAVTDSVLNFSPTTAPTQGIIRAQSEEIFDETGTINVSHGLAATITDFYALGGERTTVAGSTQWIRVRVVDQHGNAVSGATVTFSPALQMSDVSDITDGSGLAETVYTTPRESDQTTVQASVEGLATFLFTIYAIRYAPDPGLYPKVVQRDADGTFTVTVSNPGNVPVPLTTSASNIHFSGGGYSYEASLVSPAILPANNMAITLTFNTAFVNGNFPGGAYTPEIQLVGSGPDFSSMNGTFTTSPGELTIGDESITIGNIQIEGPGGTNQLLQGDTGIEATMTVLNVGISLPIEPTTTIYFKYKDGSTFTVTNLERTDELTVLESGVYSELSFTFDIPPDAIPDSVFVFARLILEGITIDHDHSQGSFLLLYSGEAEYVAGSLTPNPVIPRENVLLRASFYNGGSAGIVLDKDQSTLEILGSGIGPKKLISQYTLNGEDTTEIIFEQMTIPAGLASGNYNVRWHLHGLLTNGFVFDTTQVITNGITVVPAANLVFSNITIGEETVRQGQSDVSVVYRIRNLGGSDANITRLDHHFQYTNDQVYPDNHWIATNISPDFPSTLAAGAIRNYTVTYTLIQDAMTGTIEPVPHVHFNDTRVPGIPVESNVIQQNDSVTVIKPASIKIVSLVADVPNIPYVNVGQNYNMRLTIQNPGADEIEYARVRLVDNNLQQVGELEFNNIGPGTTPPAKNFNLVSNTKASIIYTAIIDTAWDIIGNPVAPGQPDDQSELIFYQLPSQLEINAAIAAHDSLSDSLIVSVDQIFDIRARITNFGESAFKEDGLGSLAIHFPKSHFVFSNPFSDSIRNFTATDSIVVWTLRAIDESAAQSYENIYFDLMNIPIDINTNQNVADINIDNNSVRVRNVEKGVITANIVYINQPPGAVDGVVSTEQWFMVKADISFNSTMALAGRTAELHLPPGSDFELAGEDDYEVTLTPGESPEWTVYAPERDQASDNITVMAKGYDKYSGNLVDLQSDNLPVQVVDMATLHMALDIEKESGTGDTLSVDQEFFLNVLVTKGGTAKTEGSGTVYLDGLEDLPVVSLVDQDTLKSFNVGETVSWRLKTNDPLLSKIKLQDKITEFLDTYKLESAVLPVKAGKPQPASEKTRILSEEVTDLIQKAFDQQSELTVRMLQKPDDENTNSEAFSRDTLKTQTIYIQGAAQVSISNPIYPDKVSTDQLFKFEVAVESENNLTEAVGILNLPESFVGVNGGAQLYTIPELDSNRATWYIQVPSDDYSGAMQESLSVRIVAKDGNTGLPVYSNVISDKAFIIELQPRIKMMYEIMHPNSARDAGRVSHGQSLEIDVWAEHLDKPVGSDLDYAELEGRGTIQLDEKLFTTYGFKKITGENYAPNFDSIGVKESFIVRAPAQNKTALVNFEFSNLPKDKNSGDPVFVQEGGDKVSIPITVAEKKIVVTMLPELIEESTFPRGEEYHPLIAFEISNEGYQDSLIIDEIELTFLARTDTSKLGREGILDLIESISIMDLEAAEKEMTKPSDITYVNYDVNETNASNPLNIEFDSPGMLDGGEKVTMMVMVKFIAGESSRSFRVGLTNVFAYNIDADSPVTIVDSDGQSILNNEGFLTDPISVVSNDPEKTFGNFPNPFGRAPHESTQIRFLLLKESDVTLRVFSLAGELVRSAWNKSLDNVEEGLHYVVWDGTNDNGDRVLNGVYLCAIEIRSSSGTNQYMTKIAYIK